MFKSKFAYAYVEEAKNNMLLMQHATENMWLTEFRPRIDFKVFNYWCSLNHGANIQLFNNGKKIANFCWTFSKEKN